MLNQNRELRIKNESSLEIRFPLIDDRHYALGSCSIDNQILETPLNKGLFFLREMQSGEILWLFGSTYELINDRAISFRGDQLIDGVNLAFDVSVTLAENIPGAKLQYQFSVDRRRYPGANNRPGAAG